jgi:hypothetical protein
MLGFYILTCITLFIHAGPDCMSLEYVIYITWGPQTNRKHSFNLHTFMLNFGNLGGVILLTLCTIVIIHPQE